jgi:amino-acid N-acetyltransferase
MSSEPLPPRAPAPPFTEKGFYLEEFHGKTVAIAAPAAELRAPAPLAKVVDELTANGTWVLLLSTERAALEPLVGERVLSMAMPRLEGTVWRELRSASRLGIVMAGSMAFAPACCEAAVRLGLTKLVWIDREGGVQLPDGQRASFVHLDELRELLTLHPQTVARRTTLLREIESMLVGGVPAVNVCTLDGLHDELFTYDGSGTLFTEERYVVVRRLGLDDFDAASNLIARGTDEGYLAPRSPAQLDELLASAFGAFIEGYHLAGIGALLVDHPARCAEVASLYTLTRFLGEGVGAQIVSHTLARARELGLAYVYACTISERVAGFFERNGFHRVPSHTLPAAKWRGYDPARRATLLCLRRDLAGSSGAADAIEGG